mmetsp:Transcript_45226/g.112351  ORF Transcript_45226/g.112351 Transcript_45226/m.112351 type:complete len:211 (-) Transcript_45226:589-1221(-)
MCVHTHEGDSSLPMHPPNAPTAGLIAFLPDINHIHPPSFSSRNHAHAHEHVVPCLARHCLVCLVGLTCNLVHVDVGVRRPSEECVSVGAPGERNAPWEARLGRLRRVQLLQHILILQIPYLDGVVCSGAQPVVLGGEAECVDGDARLEGVEVFALVDVPQHRRAVLAAAGAQGAVGRDGHRVQGAAVAGQVGLQLAVGQTPHLDEFVPSA